MPPLEAQRRLARMSAALRRESRDESGTCADDSLGVYVGWVARKNSFAHGMPLRSERGNVVLVFSGEEYPEPAAIRRLKERGHRLEGADATYLVHMVEEDASFPAGLNGRFHGLVTDRNTGVTTLFCDRYGMHRLYYHESADGFYFASEAKAILAVHPELRTLDARALGELVACGCVLENRTLFHSIHVLPAAAAWTFRNGAISRKARYFERREWEDQPLLEPEHYFQELRQVFSQNVGRYFAGPERIAMSLTGGLDTRLIMASYTSPPGTLPCYSFGGTFRDSEDVVVARQVAQACGQSHEVIQVGDDFLSRFAEYAERAVSITDGCASAEHSVDLYINEQAREIAPVRMTGNYGGEVLRRVRAFKPVAPLTGLFESDFLPQVHRATATYTELLQSHPLSFAVFEQAPWHHYGLLALEQTQVAVRSPFLDNDVVRTVFRAPPSAYAGNQVCLRLIEEGNRSLARIRTDRGLAAGSDGLRSAFSRRLLDFTYKAEYAFDAGMPQWVAQVNYACSPLRLERLFLGRHKFAHFRGWYQGALSGYVRDMLLDRKALSRPYLDRKAVERVVGGHLQGNRNYTGEIHQLLRLELIHRLFID